MKKIIIISSVILILLATFFLLRKQKALPLEEAWVILPEKPISFIHIPDISDEITRFQETKFFEGLQQIDLAATLRKVDQEVWAGRYEEAKEKQDSFLGKLVSNAFLDKEIPAITAQYPIYD